MKGPNLEYFATRASPEVLAALTAEADARGVKLSVIAREAFDLYISQVIENRCPVCEAPNPRGADWCCSCGAAITRAAAGEIWQEAKRALQVVEQTNAQTNAMSDKFESVVKAIVEQGRAQGITFALPASVRPRPTDEQTITEEQ